MNAVEIANTTRVGLDGHAVSRLVEAVLAAEGVDAAELAVSFVGERRIRDLNREYRGRDEVTDVLSFPLEEAGEEAGSAGPDSPPRMLGDVVVCARRALRQAREDGLPPAFELGVLVTHGVLHLLGYDHETDAGEMALRQAAVLEDLAWEGLLVESSR